MKAILGIAVVFLVVGIACAVWKRRGGQAVEQVAAGSVPQRVDALDAPARTSEVSLYSAAAVAK